MTYNLAELPAYAARLPADLRLTFQTPLRVKSGGAFLEHVDLRAIVQAACWRMAALTRFYGERSWDVDYQPIVAAARRVRLERAETRWFDWERTSTPTAGPGVAVASATGSSRPFATSRARASTWSRPTWRTASGWSGWCWRCC